MNPEIEKEGLRNYLLGNVDSARRTQLEERILSEPRVYEELSIVEADLVDQYLEGGLTELEQQQFETHFLIDPERQRNLRFGQLLKRYAVAHQSAPASPPFQRPRFGRRPVLVFSAAVVALFGIVVLTWLVTRSTTQTNVHGGIPISEVVKLTPGATESGSAPHVKVPPKGYDVTLELEVGNTSFRNYKSELFRGNRSLKTIQDLRMQEKDEQHVVPLTITGEILSPGDYQVRLSGLSDSGAAEFINNYSFHVIE
ncbi:MAG TPA: hypothetical protein VF088_05795 [Pyrinomonadaceae bacterium]